MRSARERKDVSCESWLGVLAVRVWCGGLALLLLLLHIVAVRECCCRQHALGGQTRDSPWAPMPTSPNPDGSPNVESE